MHNTVPQEYKHWYGGTIKNAVNGLSLGIPKGECFGLLGVNGKYQDTHWPKNTGCAKQHKYINNI